MGDLVRLATSGPAVRGARLIIGALFAAAALAKIGDPGSFAAQLHNFRLLPIALENLVAVTLPWIELVAALALIFGVRARAGAALATAMLAVFTVAVLSALARDLDIECGCFGTNDATRVGWVKVTQNLGMVALAALGTVRSRGLRSPTRG